MNKDLSIEGRFILFTVANSFLFNDYEICLELCETNFSPIANSNLFEGNLLRFKALTLEHLYLKHTDESKPFNTIRSTYTNSNMLTRAKEALENALEIFQVGMQNIKGKALTIY